MADDDVLTVNFPNFQEDAYLSENADVAADVKAGNLESGYQHYLRHGLDENREPRLKRAVGALDGAVERGIVSGSGFFLLLGWLSDEGREASKFKLFGPEFNIDISSVSILRHARQDVEAAVREGPFDYGFLMFGKAPAKLMLQQPLLVQATSSSGSFQARITPDIVSDKRLLDTLLIFLAGTKSHAGKEANLYRFLDGLGGNSIVELFQFHVAANTLAHHVQTFRPRAVSRSFVSVLFGSTEAMLLQPVLFRQQDIDFGEWIYVCNSPEDASAALRLGRLMSDLYDIMITVVIMTDNVGFGAANNVGISHASSDSIYIINPDVFPMAAYSEIFRRTLRERELGSKMWGGLLFYDDYNLMHSGMYIERDSFFRCPSFDGPARLAGTSIELARVEHFDKGVPFEEARWKEAKVVPAITGALMVFRRPYFEKLGGFSTRYIYGHYEDADLSLRWADAHGPVVIDPGLRLVHLEGQGSRARGEQYRGAAMTNRYLFSITHQAALQRGIAEASHIRELTSADA